MAALELDRDRIEKLLGRVVDRLSGDWVLLGGALAAVWFRQDRVTEDIDLVSIEDSQERRFELMEFVSSEGLPVEAVNSAADFFLRRIQGWKTELEPFRQGATARIYRPSPTLFLLL